MILSHGYQAGGIHPPQYMGLGVFLLVRVSPAAEVVVHGKLCFRRLTVQPAILGRIRSSPALTTTLEVEPALLGKVQVNECRE